MKIINNYDLMEEVNSANGGINLQRILLNELKTQAILYGAFAGFNLALSSDHEIRWLTNIMICGGWFVGKVALFAALEKGFKDRTQFIAYIKLVKLSLQLADLNINTSPDLLKEAKVQQINYKVRLSENYLPLIQQNKYIRIPAYDGLGDIKDASLLQEHNVGSKEYILSIGSPQKVMQLKLAFNM